MTFFEAINMVDQVDSNSQIPANVLQKATAVEQNNAGNSNQQVQNNSSQAVNQDSVSISSNAIETQQQESSRTSIQNSQQAREVADRVSSLLQQQPELAATAQGGRVTSEKVNAQLANLS